MSEVAGLTEDERDWIADVWDEETTVSASAFYPLVARIVAQRQRQAWDEGYEAGTEDELNAYWGTGPYNTPNPYGPALAAVRGALDEEAGT